MFSGSGELPTYVAESDFKCVQDNFRYLGIIFTRDLKDMPAINFKRKVEVISNMLKGWLRWRLTFYGKRTVLKSLALSKFTYILTVLPDPTSVMVKSFQREFFLNV